MFRVRQQNWDIVSTIIKFFFQKYHLKIRILSLSEFKKCNTLENYKKISLINNEHSKNIIDKKLNNKIKHIAGSFIKVQDVPTDGDSGA